MNKENMFIYIVVHDIVFIVCAPVAKRINDVNYNICLGLFLFIFALLTYSRIWYSVLHESMNLCTACTALCTLEYINSIEDLEQYTQGNFNP